MAVPVLMRMAKGWLFPVDDFRAWAYGLWIYLSGSIFIFGACLCASQAEALRQSDTAKCTVSAADTWQVA